jgi:hypothetical protein
MDASPVPELFVNAEAALHLEQQKSESEIELLDTHRALRSGTSEEYESGMEIALLRYIGRRVIAFAEALMNSGNHPIHVRGGVDEYLIVSSNKAFDWNHPQANRADREQTRARFLGLAVFVIRNSDVWAEYQRMLIEYSKDYFSRAAFPVEAVGAETPDTSKLTVSLGLILDKLRAEKGWSFDEFAIHSGIDKKSLIAYTKKRRLPNPANLAKLARCLDVSVENLRACLSDPANGA